MRSRSKTVTRLMTCGRNCCRAWCSLCVILLNRRNRFDISFRRWNVWTAGKTAWFFNSALSEHENTMYLYLHLRNTNEHHRCMMKSASVFEFWCRLVHYPLRTGMHVDWFTVTMCLRALAIDSSPSSGHLPVNELSWIFFKCGSDGRQLPAWRVATKKNRLLTQRGGRTWTVEGEGCCKASRLGCVQPGIIVVPSLYVRTKRKIR